MSISSPLQTYPGVRKAVITSGVYRAATAAARKSTAVLIPGWNCDSSELKGLIEPLRGNGHDVLVVELPKKSRGDQTITSDNYFDACAATVLTACRVYGVERFCLIGHSMGGLAINAILRTAANTSDLKPYCLIEISPVKTDPRTTLPNTNKLERFASFVTRLLANITYYFTQKFEDTGKVVYDWASIVAVKTMLTVFTLAGPVIIKLNGGLWAAVKEFWKYCLNALKFDGRTSATTLLAMCKQQAPEPGEFLVPPRVAIIGGQKDIFVSPALCKAVVSKMYGDDRITFDIMPTGHFAHKEDPGSLIALVLSTIRNIKA